MIVMMQFTTFDGTSLFYKTLGPPTHTPLVLLHGLGGDHRMWEPQLAHYPAQGFFLIALDVRGHGQSAPVASFTVRDCARDVVALLDYLGLAHAHLAGVSMGGLIVQQTACDFPNRVARLVIADSYSEVHTLTEKAGAWSNWFTIRFLPWLFPSVLKAGYQVTQKAWARRYLLESYARTEQAQLVQARAHINRFAIRKQLGQVQAPSLVLVGDDLGDLPIQMARKIADALPHARFRILPGGCDPSNLVVPQQFDQEVLAFLSETA